MSLESLSVAYCDELEHVDVKSIGDFTFLTSPSRYQDNTTIKQFSGNMEHFLSLERLKKEMNQTPEAEHKFNENVLDLDIPSVATLPTNSEELISEQSTSQQHSLGEIGTTSKLSQGDYLEGSTTSENNVAANLPSISETKNDPFAQLVGPKQKGVEGGAKLTNANTITSSTHLELEQDVDVRDSPKTTKTNNDHVTLNDGAFVRVTSIIEEQFSKDDPSRSNVLHLPFSFQTHSMPFQGNPSKKLEDSSSLSLITCELEQLVSKKLLAIENLSLLTDFLVKHPSVLLRDTSLSNRYKGYAYNCLAELLKFLQTHSLLDVLGSSRSEFVELLQDVRKCGFDKDWLDGVEKHALFPDLQFSQDALQKLLDSQQHVTKEVEEINLKLNIFSQHVEDLKHQLTSSEAVLESIIQQKAQVLETKAALSAPLGY
ncbi:hypothetical protein P8452_21197 [Trifolium repens]|nr:hypothetical protein P8452_21197 [Trifolium repens]